LVAFERYKHNKRGGEVDMGLKWVDSLDIAIELNDKFPDVDPMHVNFVDLRNWVLELDEFDDDPEHSGERILEAIQMAWIEEKE
jgi:FeS assembly protein IscX